MSNIPTARERLAQIADEVEAEGLADAAKAIRDTVALLHRRPPARPRARTQSAPVSPDVVRSIRRIAASYPDVPLQKIAEMFSLNAGRVSEVLQGDR